LLAPETDRVDVPEPPLTVLGLKLVVAPETPVTLNATSPVNPPEGEMLMLYVAVPLPLSVTLPGVADIEKSPDDGALTTSVTLVV